METRGWPSYTFGRNRLRNGLKKREKQPCYLGDRGSKHTKLYVTIKTTSPGHRVSKQTTWPATRPSGFTRTRKRTTPRCILAQHFTRRVLGTTRAEGAQAAVRYERGWSVIAWHPIFLWISWWWYGIWKVNRGGGFLSTGQFYGYIIFRFWSVIMAMHGLH